MCKRNLRPISLKEYQDLKVAQQSIDQELLSKRAQELERQLKEKSGVFQFSDLSDLEVSPPVEPSAEVADPPPVNGSNQPEEEPYRRPSTTAETQLPPAHEIPVLFENDDELFESHQGDSSDYLPTAPSMGSDNLGTEAEGPIGDSGNHHPTEDVGVIFNASLIEPALDGRGDIVEDDNTLWSDKENPVEDCCVFEFCVPVQQIRKYRNHPVEAIALIASAARKSHAEVSYKNLTKEEKACLM